MVSRHVYFLAIYVSASVLPPPFHSLLNARSNYRTYPDSRSDKPARGALLTAVQRNMNRDTILIVDAPNYIKGFRYQMYCAAREAKLRVCTVRSCS